MTIHGQDSGAVPDHSTIEIHTKDFSCEGGEDTPDYDKHPIVYYHIGDEGSLLCEYCGIKYVYVGGGHRIDWLGKHCGGSGKIRPTISSK